VTTRESTFAMIDLAGYTALTEHHGDLHAADLAVAFADLARGCLRGDDRLIKTIGDAVLLAAATPRDGIQLVERVLDALGTLDGAPLTRAGLHHGEAVERDGDVFGTAVNIASRVATHAEGGQVLATKTVEAAARELGVPVTPQGSSMLKNLSEPYELFDLALGPDRDAGSVDPVCRMWIQRTNATGPQRFNDHDYWFCSTDCAARFAAEPTKYTG
jgi:adenylate cyclase